MNALAITADDFGLAREVNEAVEIAHVRGVLTAASLMVGAPAAADAIIRARRLPTLRVGLHLVLVDGRPLLPADEIPDLVDATGAFRDDMTRAGIAIFLRSIVRHQVAAEIEAQFAAFATTGLPLDHVNAHKHFHLHPTIAQCIVEASRRYGFGSVRVPDEPSAHVRVGWLAGAVEVWIALVALGQDHAIEHAVMIESLIQTISSVAFIVPGALGVQEGGFLLIGAALGLDGPTALALAASRRLRDAVIFFPGLLAWNWFEGRAKPDSRAEAP